MLRLSIALSPVLLVVLVSSTARGQDGSGWPTEALVAQISTLVGGKIEVQSGKELPSNLLIDPTEEQACFLRPEENVRYVQHGDAGTAVLIGDDRVTHTIQFYYPVLTVSGNERAPEFYRGIFRYLFPHWPGAAEWPMKSVGDSWTVTGQAMIDPTISIDQMIARHSEGTVRLATSGVPPDVAWLRVTTRSDCEKISAYLLASPREVPKNEAQRQMTQEWGQLLLNYVHPMPVDVSATPILLGTVYANNRHGESGPTLRFDPPGVEADMRDWIDQQATDRYASTLEAISADWGYTSHFIHLIEQPRLPVEADGEAYLLVVEKLNSAVLGPLANGLSFAPTSAESVVFAAEMPPPSSEKPVPSDTFFAGSDIVDYGNRLPEPPEAAKSCGIEIPCGQRPFYLATDVSDTPVHLGGLYLYFGGHSGDRPGYYEVRVEGMTVVAIDRESGEEAVLDLAAWARAQGNFDGPAGGRVIRVPKLAFELGGKRHVLVIQGTTLNREKGKVESLSGQLFTTTRRGKDRPLSAGQRPQLAHSGRSRMTACWPKADML